MFQRTMDCFNVLFLYTVHVLLAYNRAGWNLKKILLLQLWICFGVLAT
jgi:hypothetical protein